MRDRFGHRPRGGPAEGRLLPLGGRPRSGTEPTSARSPLGLRLLLSAVYAPLFLAGAAGFSVWAAYAEPDGDPSRRALATVAGICAALALLAALDLYVVLRRRERERDRRPPA
ncbi:DUF6343 family protein [Streptomyces sp. URMC 123]|uniref:DUF6343 family protein n=1 Tax=Streptomyces sp. URMC 123 TaxID=3423403 RepID=UPI003F1A65E3